MATRNMLTNGTSPQRPHPTRASRRQATGMLRTLVIASATMAILVVCFSIYQNSQLDPETLAKVQRPRLPESRERPIGYDVPPEDAAAAGVPVGSVKIGAGRKIHMTLYREQSERAWIELSVTDWTPVKGAANEFLLSEPDIRLRTKDGHPVRVRADRGNLEAHRRSGTGLDPKRGRLEGHVTIEYDRLNETQRAALPPERRDRIEPEDLVRIELSGLEFDLEYAKLIIPGQMHLSARDVVFDAEDLEMRFNDVQNRVEYLRIGRGGRIDIREQTGQLGLGLPGAESTGPTNVTVVEWLRATLESKLAEQAAAKAGSTDSAPGPNATADENGIPVFRPETEDNSKPTRSLKYYARFHGDVVAAQFAGESVESQLTAELLELVRTLSEQERAPEPPSGASPAATGGAPPEAPTTPQQRIVLTWHDRLVVEACNEDDERCAGAARALVRATGSPVRLVSPEGSAECQRLTFDPDGGKVWVEGSDTEPAVVDYGDQGIITGATIYTDRRDDEILVRVTGPGSLRRVEPENAATEKRPEPGDSHITFAGQLEAHGRVVTYRPQWYRGDISTRTRRVLDKATFSDAVRLVEQDTTLDADKVDVTFGENRAYGTIIEHVSATGHVRMAGGENRLTCREMDVTMTTDKDGRPVPSTAVARGDVTANQGERTISAREKLTLDFAMVPQSVPLFNPTEAYIAALGRGERPTATDINTMRAAHDAQARTKLGVTRLRADGDVNVTNAAQQLDLTAEQLDCTIAAKEDGSSDIDNALIEGTADRPARARLRDLTVTGSTIRLDAPDEWVEVPSAGRLTYRSFKKLSGAKSDQLTTTAVSWTDSMTYQGRENRAEFLGDVHASSEEEANATTFDCDRLRVEFEDISAADESWPAIKSMLNRLTTTAETKPTGRPFRKEPTYILADGHAVALSSRINPESYELDGRARIEGPRLSVYLRDDVSKMIIEGPGTLLLEDYQTKEKEATKPAPGGESLLGMDGGSGPSNTLIQWQDEMWYDFSVDQTLFRGDVSLKHFSGARLAALAGRVPSTDDTTGRATFLTCNALMVDFLSRNDPSSRADDQRIGRLSSQRLEQFQATGSVVLQDQSEGLSLTADNVIYWKSRSLLAIYGSPSRKAHIVKQKPGKAPSQASAERLFYNLTTGDWELMQPSLKSR